MIEDMIETHLRYLMLYQTFEKIKSEANLTSAEHTHSQFNFKPKNDH